MGSKSADDGVNVSMEFEIVAVTNADRYKKFHHSYTNLHCDNCKEWWIMICLGDKKKVYCPWCASKLKITQQEKV